MSWIRRVFRWMFLEDPVACFQWLLNYYLALMLGLALLCAWLES